LYQLLSEGLVIGALGAGAGWMLAHWGVEALLALAPSTLPRREAVAVDGSLALFAMATGLLCSVVVSLVPAWHSTHSNLVRQGRDSPSHAGGRTRGVLIAAQLALSVILLVGAGLMMRAFVNLRSVPPGFDPRDRASLFISLDGSRWNPGTYAEATALRRGFYERLSDQARDLPGVRQAGVGFPVPHAGIAMSQRVSIGPAAPHLETDGFTALDGYLETLGVPLVAGRYFTRADNSQLLVIVDEHLARQLWPGEPAVGRRLLVIRSVSSPLSAEVVGVVRHVQSRGPRDEGPPQIWMTHAVRAYAQLNVVVHATDPIEAAGRITKTVRELGAGLPVRDVRRLEDNVRAASADTRFALFVLAVLAALAVSLAAVGVYGVVSYAMSRRTREIAVRLALGASPRQLVARVLREGAIWTLVGLTAGTAGAAVLARFLETLLFRIEPHDALTFAAVAALLGAVTLAATVIPALRAASVDPMLALRSD
jgi:putative ABC transport system permease protein